MTIVIAKLFTNIAYWRSQCIDVFNYTDIFHFEPEYNTWYNYKQLGHNYSLKSSVQCYNQCEHRCPPNDDCHFVVVKSNNVNVMSITIEFITTTRTQQQAIPVRQIQVNY